MPNALLTGVSGLIAHQRMLDTVGNNLANVNTHGFKVRRTLFTDLLYETIRPAASSSTGNVGGVNPNQIGSGVKIAQVSSKFGQGNLELTGGDFDFALQGDGFFVVSDGSRNLYTRNGSFSVDRSGYLVDPNNGYRVRRFGTLGEGAGNFPQFQEPSSPFINIPFGAIIAGRPTTEANISGNLESTAKGPQMARLTTASAFKAGGSAATDSTLLNDLDTNTTDYVDGDEIVITGFDFDGTPISTTFTVSTSSTLGDLVSAIDAAFSGATATLDANGNIVLTADDNGETNLSLSLADAAGNPGKTSFISNHQFLVTVEGSTGDTFETGIVVYDLQGAAHNVNLVFRKTADNRWNLTASIAGSSGTVIDGSVDDLVFNETGTQLQVLGTGLGDPTLTFQFQGIPTTQTVQLNFAANDQSQGLTQVAARSDVVTRQDGFGPGALSTISVGLDGIISGVATNGTIVPIAQLAIATFQNRNGLNSVASSYYEQSLNSGEAQVGTALSGSRGAVLGGQLEASNVDIALEFTNLIVAQRGFSANARTIRVADEVLEELTNVIR